MSDLACKPPQGEGLQWLGWTPACIARFAGTWAALQCQNLPSLQLVIDDDFLPLLEVVLLEVLAVCGGHTVS